MADKAKKTKKSAQSLTIPSIGAIFGRFHAVIFAVVVCGSLAVVVYLLGAVLNDSSTLTNYQSSTNTSFDTSTIQRVKDLRPLSESPSSFEFPEGRTDPFAQ